MPYTQEFTGEAYCVRIDIISYITPLENIPFWEHKERISHFGIRKTPLFERCFPIRYRVSKGVLGEGYCSTML